MKRHSTVGEIRFKVWVLSTGIIRIDECVVEFDSPNEEWITTRGFMWGKKSTHNKIDKATGHGKYTEGGNRQIVFRTKPEAEAYQKQLELTPIAVRQSWHL